MLLNQEQNIPRTQKIISNFLIQNSLHSEKKFKIRNETITTYDGLYPSFEIIYENVSNIWVIEQRKYLIELIEKYTGLKHNSNFWLGVSYEE
jgi:hypothetical protein